MKKSLIFITSFLLLFFVSCSNSDATNESDVEIDTLKTILKDKDDFTLWTKEIEASLLTEEIKNEEFQLGSNIDFSSEIFNILSNKKKSIYPELYSFGSLDSSELNEGVRNRINNFLTSVSSNPYSEKDEFFEKKYIFNYVFFLNELSNNYEKKFSVKMPEKADYEEKKSEENESTEENIEKKEAEKKVPAIFTRWILGEPFVSNEIIQIPVRIYYRKNFIDVNIYLKNNQSYNIYNINIIRWG